MPVDFNISKYFKHFLKYESQFSLIKYKIKFFIPPEL